MTITAPAATSIRSIPGSRPERILFAGDGVLSGAAACAASVILAEGFGLTHIPSDTIFPDNLDLSTFSLIILSDYHANNIGETAQRALVARVNNGATLLMIGGFLSFAGADRCYNKSLIATILPVVLSQDDDRRNVPQGIVPFPAGGDTPFTHLDWSTPPVICGYNAIEPRAEATIHLFGMPLVLTYDNSGFIPSMGDESIPLCMSHSTGTGKTVALAFDLAPHWIGGMIDWGKERRTIDQAGRPVEMGTGYYDFVKTLIHLCIPS